MAQVKKIILVLVGLILILGLGWYLVFGRSNKLINPGEQTNSDQTAIKYDFELNRWEDPAGFALSYPQQLTLDSHDDDETNYAWLDFSHPEKSGSIRVIVNDSDYADLDDWSTKDELVKDGNALETKLAGFKAKRVALTEGQETIAMIDADQVIYVLTKTLGSEEPKFWNHVYKAITDSFELIPLEGETEAQFENWLGDFDTTGADIVEAVETIQ